MSSFIHELENINLPEYYYIQEIEFDNYIKDSSLLPLQNNMFPIITSNNFKTSFSYNIIPLKKIIKNKIIRKTFSDTKLNIRRRELYKIHKIHTIIT